MAKPLTKKAKKRLAAEKVRKEREKVLFDKVTALWAYYGPDFYLVHPQANKILFQSGIDLDEITPAIARHADREVMRLYESGKHPPRPKGVTVETPFEKDLRENWKGSVKKWYNSLYRTPQEASDKDVIKALTPLPKASPVDEPVPDSLPEPELRDSEGLYRIYAPVMSPPFTPEDAKFKTLLTWGEKVRDFYQMRGIYITVQALGNWASRQFKDPDRQIKAARRVFAIYQEELEQERSKTRAMVEKAERGPDPKEVKQKATKDRWGFRTGTISAAINEVITKEPKTIKRIAFESDAPPTRVRLHLGILRKRKLVKKLPDGKFRERKVKK